jgi:hypothetical protein
MSGSMTGPGPIARRLEIVTSRWALALALVAVAASRVRADDSVNHAEITADQVVAYEEPNPTSVALRLLYRGEVVVVRGQVTANDRTWLRIALGGQRSAYVAANLAGATTFAPTTSTWAPERAIRDERPVAVAALGYGISQGAGVQLRYLPFTRLGLSFSAGTILGPHGLEGSVLAFGVQGLFSLGKLTPIGEVGGAILMSEAQRSRQRIQALYVSAGLEWMFDNGLYVAALATYWRSLRIEILFPHDDATFVRDEYGSLDATGSSSVQRLVPALLVGYAF